MVCLGDFFDKDVLSGEELTALQEVKWYGVPHHFVVGNHEMSSSDLSKSSQHIMQLMPNVVVHDCPDMIEDDAGNSLCFLPYQLNENVRLIDQYFPTTSNRIVFSHNNLKGVQMGKFLSDEGLDIQDISNGCELFINGHFHNAGVVANGVWNVGTINVILRNAEGTFTHL